MLFYAGPSGESTFSCLHKHFDFTLNDPPTSDDNTRGMADADMAFHESLGACQPTLRKTGTANQIASHTWVKVIQHLKKGQHQLLLQRLLNMH